MLSILNGLVTVVFIWHAIGPDSWLVKPNGVWPIPCCFTSAPLPGASAARMRELLQLENERARASGGSAAEQGSAQFVELHVVLARMSQPALPALGGLVDCDGSILEALAPRPRIAGTQIIEGGGAYVVWLHVLRERGLVRVLDESHLVARSGSPVCFDSGGRVAHVHGMEFIQCARSGTKVRLLPMVQPNGRISIQVKLELESYYESPIELESGHESREDLVISYSVTSPFRDTATVKDGGTLVVVEPDAELSEEPSWVFGSLSPLVVQKNWVLLVTARRLNPQDTGQTVSE